MDVVHVHSRSTRTDLSIASLAPRDLKPRGSSASIRVYDALNHPPLLLAYYYYYGRYDWLRLGRAGRAGVMASSIGPAAVKHPWCSLLFPRHLTPSGSEGVDACFCCSTLPIFQFWPPLNRPARTFETSSLRNDAYPNHPIHSIKQHFGLRNDCDPPVQASRRIPYPVIRGNLRSLSYLVKSTAPRLKLGADQIHLRHPARRLARFVGTRELCSTPS